MSDYGDDYSDYGEDWFYVEDEYMAADDLAEHAVASPPPTTYGDEDMQPDWDRFDYFNDLEYASDGYDNATFEVHKAKNAAAGQKRKRTITKTRSKKRRSIGAATQPDVSVLEHPPVIWRAQADREIEAKPLEENAPSYALLKDWKEKLANTPRWARGSPRNAPDASPSKQNGLAASFAPAPASPPSELDDEQAEEDMEDGDAGINEEALMAALQRQLAAAGGPLSGMDPQQLLQFAMRMATNQDAGDDIAGEMADAMLEGDDEEDDADAEENLLSWVAQQRNANKGSLEDTPKSPDITRDGVRPPTPPSSEANRSVHVSETTTKATKATSSLKRKADEAAEGGSETKTVKKRVTRSFDAPTAASQAKAAPSKTTRSTRAKRP